MRRLLMLGAAGAALLLLARPGAAQQWRVTPFAGGSVIAGTESSVEFENSFAVGLSGMYRTGHWGFELSGQWIPTRMTSIVGFTTRTVLDDLGPADSDPLLLAYSNTQNVFLVGGNLTYFTTSGWNSDEPPPAREFYGVVGAGLVNFADAHPAREGFEALSQSVQDQQIVNAEQQGWEAGTTEFMINVGAGLQLNLTTGLSVQFELRDGIFKAVERNESILQAVEAELQQTGSGRSIEPVKTWQHAIVFRQGVSFVLF